MKERLIQLLDLEQLTPSKFADLIGVQRSSISHVISGRNKPSFDFLQKTLKAFPGLNASWLMLGEGSMYEQMGRQVSGNLFDPPDAPKESREEPRSEIEEAPSETAPPEPLNESPAETGNRENEIPAELSAAAAISGSEKRVVQVLIIYEDDTFKTLAPSH